MQSSDINHEELVNLLYCAAPTKHDAQKFFEKQLDVRVPRSNYAVMWDRLVDSKGKVDAAYAVFRLALHYSNREERKLFGEARRKGYVAHEDTGYSGIIDCLFFNNGKPRKLGSLFLDFCENKQRTAPGSREPGIPVSEDAEQRASASMVFPDGSKPVSARRGLGMEFERVSVSTSGILKVQPDWSEAQIEEHLAQKWADIDFGLEEPLTLEARQRPFPGAGGRVDFLAKSTSGRWIVVELKCKEASGADLTQLMGYMNNLAREQRIDFAEVHGMLLAPSFSARVLDAAAHDRTRLMLLRFLRLDDEA